MDTFPINSADLIVVAVVAISGIFALLRGLVHELLSLGAWFGAGIATYYGIDRLIPVARRLTEAGQTMSHGPWGARWRNATMA